MITSVDALPPDNDIAHEMDNKNYVPLDDRWNTSTPESASAKQAKPVRQNGTVKELSLGLGRNRNSIPTALPEIPPAQPAPPPQDGGLIGWLQVLGCFFCWFNSWYALPPIPVLILLSLILQQGPHQCLWGVPSLLRISPTQFTLTDLLDWIDTIIPVDLHWSVDRTTLRRRILTSPSLVGRLPRRLWLHDDESLQPVLANHASPRNYHRSGVGMLVHPVGRNTTAILCQEKSFG